MAYIDTTYVDNAISTATRLAYAPTTSAFAQYEAQARATVQAAAQVAGYSLTTTSSNAMVRLLTLGQWVFFAGGMRQGISVPPAVADAIGKLELVRSGAMPIPGLTPSTQNGIGGVKFSSSSDTDTDGRPQYFSRKKLADW